MVGTNPMRRPRARSARDQSRISFGLESGCIARGAYSALSTIESVR